MTAFLNYLRTRYSQKAALLCTAFVFILAGVTCFRLNILQLTAAIYPDLGVKIPHLFFISLPADIESVLVCFLFLAPFLILSPRRIAHIMTWFVPALLLTSLWMGIDFFRTYETAFQPSFTDSENLTGLPELARSIMAETSFSFYVRLLVTFTLLPFVTWLVSYFSRTEKIRTRLNGVSSRVIPALLVLLALTDGIIRTFNSGNHTALVTGSAAKSGSHSIEELAGNPLHSIIFIPGTTGTVHHRQENSGTDGFSFGLNTDSMVAGGNTPRTGIPRGRRYNIILYFFESTPRCYLDLTLNGKPVAPVWHELARHAFIAENHYANYPLSASAMLSVLASAYEHPSSDHVIQKYPHVPLKTLPEILKSRGYRTCVLHTGDLRYAGQRRFLTGRGIDRIIEMKDLEHRKPFNVKVGWGLDERVMTEPAVEFMKESAGSPFFAAVFPANPHHPYAIPDDSFRITGPLPHGSDQKLKNWYNYLNSLHFADAALGHLIYRLKEEELLENTLLFVFADHGEAFYQHHRNYNHPFFLYEENVHVPFLIYNEKLFSDPFHYQGISRHVDILPTVLDALSLPADQRHEGKSLFSGGRNQLALLHTSWKDDLLGVRDGRWKYIKSMSDSREELYDIENDPGEKNNIADEKTGLAERFRNYVMSARRYNVMYYDRVLEKSGHLSETPARKNRSS